MVMQTILCIIAKLIWKYLHSFFTNFGVSKTKSLRFLKSFADLRYANVIKLHSDFFKICKLQSPMVHWAPVLFIVCLYQTHTLHTIHLCLVYVVLSKRSIIFHRFDRENSYPKKKEIITELKNRNTKNSIYEKIQRKKKILK